MKKIYLLIVLLSLFAAGCKKCYFCGGNYNGDICEGNPEFQSISTDSIGEHVYHGIRGNYVCAPQ